MKVIGLF